MLILKFLGLIAGPLLFFLLLLLANIFLPTFASNRMVTKDVLSKTSKITIGHYSVGLEMDCESIAAIRKISRKIDIVYYTISCVIAILSALFISPFLFCNAAIKNDTLQIIIGMIIVLVVLSPVVRLLRQVFDDYDFNYHIINSKRYTNLREEIRDFMRDKSHKVRLDNDDDRFTYDRKAVKELLETKFADCGPAIVIEE